LAVVLLLEIDEIAARIDDGDAERIPVSLLRLGARCRGDLPGGLQIDRLAIGRRRQAIRDCIVRLSGFGASWAKAPVVMRSATQAAPASADS
jgi:hypothetical protein